MANLLNQQRYITDVIAPAARKANSGFDLFWNGCGSGIFVSENDDHEEHARKVAAITWAAAIEACARAAEGFTEERDDRQWVPGSLYDTLRRETAADIRKLSNAKSEPTARLFAQVGSTDGLGVAVPPAPTFGETT